MFRRTRSPQPIADDLLAQWLHAVLLGSRGDAHRIEGACRDVVEAFSSRDEGLLAGALGRFGRQLGAQGWALVDITRWITQLAELAGELGDDFNRFDVGVALAHGWADGYMQGSQSGECVDGLTGLVTLPVLRLRLRQVYEQCSALGVPPDQVYCLVVVDTDLTDRPPLEREAAMVVVAEQTRRFFRSGETVAVSDSRILVLASRTDATRNGLLDLLSAVKIYPLLSSGGVFGWLEDLPIGGELLDTYLLDVAA
jgi:hypothetical protein